MRANTANGRMKTSGARAPGPSVCHRPAKRKGRRAEAQSRSPKAPRSGLREAKNPDGAEHGGRLETAMGDLFESFAGVSRARHWKTLRAAGS